MSNARNSRILDALQARFPIGATCAFGNSGGETWHWGASSLEFLVVVDYSLQHIGGPDRSVVVFASSERLEFPPGTFPSQVVLPNSQAVRLARFIEGLDDEQPL